MKKKVFRGVHYNIKILTQKLYNSSKLSERLKKKIPLSLYTFDWS